MTLTCTRIWSAQFWSKPFKLQSLNYYQWLWIVQRISRLIRIERRSQNKIMEGGHRKCGADLLSLSAQFCVWYRCDKIGEIGSSKSHLIPLLKKCKSKMALIKLMLILPFCLFAIFQLIGCDEHVRKRKDSRQGKSKSLSINLIIRYHNLNIS